MFIIVMCIFFISLNSFFIPFFFGKKLGFKGTFLFIISSSLINLSLSIYLFVCQLSNVTNISSELYTWISIELINISWGFLIDPIASSMLIIITYISFCAHLYSFEYLKGDPHLNRFFCYLSLFTFFMIILVLSENVIQLFIGWEGVGICSYLLINYWSNRIQANKSSILAVLANKIGDIALLIASLLLQSIYKSVSFLFIKEFSFLYQSNYILDASKTVLVLKNNFSNNIFDNYLFNTTEILEIVSHIHNFELISVMLIVACIGKSAQFGFHFWLPEAMEGPTPVSSLIHAATMVTAGIFLILRFSDFFVSVSSSYSIIMLVGSITLFFASSIGLTQTDIKKIIAYSTCSQLGYMFLSCGFQNYSNGMYHLFIHAFFKALLFLTAGYLIHLLSNEQDIRKMGGLLKLLPFSYSMMLIGSYSLAGLPFLSGFFSKDPLMENIIMVYSNSFFFNNNILVSFIIVLSLLTVLITGLYSIKSLLDIYFFSYKGFKHYVTDIHYSSYFIQIPLILLCIATIYSGYIFQDAFIGINNDFLAHSIHSTKNNIHYLFDSNNYNVSIKNSAEKNGIITEFYPYYRFYVLHILLYSLIIFTALKFIWMDFYELIAHSSVWEIYVSVLKKYIYINRLLLIPMVYKVLNSSYDLFLSLFDKGVIELVGPYGSVVQINHAYSILKLQSGFLYHYIGFIYITLIITLLSITFIF